MTYEYNFYDHDHEFGFLIMQYACAHHFYCLLLRNTLGLRKVAKAQMREVQALDLVRDDGRRCLR